MADFTALLSSIVQVASTGVTLAGTLRDAGDALANVEKRLRGIDRDIDFTSRALAQLGAHLEDPEVQDAVSADTVRVTRDAAAGCAAIFTETESIVAKIRETGSTGKEPYHIREAKMDVLRANLGRVEGNLELLNGVLVHGRQMSSG
ncbi:hypothetical protein C8A05DRAFT_15708 [Staphylotrichum tortipilum]|uniref:Fungal N-terminal domain-containing protein n=1 Tax=Staphylotrichum tortipilum TaxID=2831512 RepID=A0AAN6MLH4_9PEZI|nr:hypothetical protein C8A05DRAFT_15708 [Staphylotrichum longicolle]